ncbi:unnamed protein product [Allacma fusca]|uniref:Coronin n=1 Tax=Allacma fusca TaxID=39272 RepID=A0A8J2LGW5_9HEXA|nr:unnamed protein product [Allacma fusca]
MVDCTSCTKPNEKFGLCLVLFYMDVTNSQLGFRGVRTSKFRHVFGQPARKEFCYDNIKITKNAHDCNFCACNPKFLAIVTEVAGGGSFLVLPLEKVGRIEYHNASKVTGHSGPVLDVKWNPFNDNIIASSSDDATVKVWYIPDGGLQSNLTDWLVELTGHKRRVGFIEWHPTAENILASVGFDYLVVIWHVIKGEIVNVIDCHPDIIYSISFNRDGSLLATTCKDKKLRIIDPRTGKVVNENHCHEGTKATKVVYLGDTERVITTGFSRYSDRQFAVWDQRNLSKPLTLVEIDSSSGILFPYYDHDTKMLYLAGKGDGNIRYYEIVDHAPWAHYLNQFLSGFPQRGLGYMPKRGCEVLRCEVARFYKLHAIKGLCEPISMIVPRKSDQFQEDIFPDTAAPSPSLTAHDWISGVNKPPISISLRTGVVVKTHKPVFTKPADYNGATIDRNNEKKFAFLSQETVPDYRTLDEDYGALEGEASDSGPNSFDYDGFDDGYDDCDYDVEHDMGRDRGDKDTFDGYDSGVHTDFSLGTVAHPSPPPISSRSASTKIQELINSLQQEANRFVTAREKEKDTKEKWEKTRMNQAVQQKKVAAIVSQLQNTGSAPNLATTIASLQKSEGKSEKDKEFDTLELSTFDDYRRAYMRKSFEVERLQLQVAVRDRRIKELEDYIENVAKGKPPPAKTIRIKGLLLY